MIFQQIDLYNWAAYKGSHSIKFASGKKNVTLIKGRNQRGKTTLLLAFKWVLYGDTDSIKYPDYISILNRDAKNEGDLKASVCLRLKIDDSIIEISRSIKGRSSAKRPNNSDFTEELIITKDGRAIAENPHAFINSFMAQEISEFFLFNGEDLGKYVELGKEAIKNIELKNAIERVIQTPFLKSAKALIKIIKKSNFELIKDSSTGEAAEINERISQLLELEESFNTQIGSLEKDQKTINENFRLAKSNWDNFSENLESAEKLKEAEAHSKLLAEQLNEEKNNSKNILKFAYKIIAKHMIQSASKNKDSNEQILADQSRKILLEKSIKDSRCAFCDENLSKKQLDSYKKELETFKTENISKDFLNDIAIENKIIGTSQEFQSLIDSVSSLEKLNSDIVTNSLEIDSLRDDLGSQTPNDIQDAFNKYQDAKGAKELNESSIAALRNELDGPKAQENADLYGKSGLLHALEILRNQRPDPQGGKQSKEEMLDDIYTKLDSILQKSISDLSNEVKDVIHKEGNLIYKEMLSDETQNSLQINNDFGLELVDRNGEVISDSSGGDQIMVMALFHGLKKATGIQGPLVIDTPLARIDEENSPEILKVLPRIATQCILIPHSKEMPDGGNEEMVLAPIIGKRYVINKLSDQQSEIQEK